LAQGAGNKNELNYGESARIPFFFLKKINGSPHEPLKKQRSFRHGLQDDDYFIM